MRSCFRQLWLKLFRVLHFTSSFCIALLLLVFLIIILYMHSSCYFLSKCEQLAFILNVNANENWVVVVSFLVIDQDYRLSFYMRQSWFDSRFVFNSTEHSNIKRLKLDDSNFPLVWIPDVFFRNEKGASFHKVTQKNHLFYIKEDGYLWYVSK